MDDEERWKEELHTGWTTPAEIIDRYVRSTSGSAVATQSRIIGGEGNEVWSITTRSGDDLIVRISRSTTFASERWSTEQAYRMGVPVPEVLLVDDAVRIVNAGGTGDVQVAIWIHRTIHGDPLWTVNDEQLARRLTADAGELLAHIHAVRMGGSGPIDAEGCGLFDGFSAYLASEWTGSAADAAIANGISRADVDQAAQLIETYNHIWATPPHLLHGDWLPEHVLVSGDVVEGVIDFGNTRSGDPSYDIAYWQFFWGADLYPASALLDGYRRVGGTGDLLDLRVHLCRLSLSMRAISYYTEAGRTFPAGHAAQRFREALAGLRTGVV